DSPVVKKKMSLVFYKFIKWQNDPAIYVQDLREYREQIEPLWRGLLHALSFPSNDNKEEYSTWERIEYQV
ncbi:MAG: hypothetical protein ACRENF_02205, partial [Thermodesulfobacteriota bacterium]